MIKITEKLLDQKQADLIEEKMTSNIFGWFITKGIVYRHEDNYQFTHNFYDIFQPRSNYMELINPIVKKINPSSIIRIKANLIPKTKNIIETNLHKDIGHAKGNKTAIYYVNTNNGYTEFENENKVNCIANSMLIFKANNKHRGCSQTDSDYKSVININFK